MNGLQIRFFFFGSVNWQLSEQLLTAENIMGRKHVALARSRAPGLCSDRHGEAAIESPSRLSLVWFWVAWWCLSAKLGRFDLVLSWHRNEPNPISFRDIRMSCEPFITTINIHHIYHKRQWFQASDSVYSGRISSIPDGYHLFRTDSVHTERMQDIRGVSGTSI